MRHHLRLRVLLPALASLVAACGGGTESTDHGGTTSSSGTSGSSSSSSGGGTSSSSGATSSSSSSGSTETFTLNYCEPNNGGLVGFPGVTVSQFDYLEVRDYVDATDGPSQSQGKIGTACATATDKPACQTKLTNFNAAGWVLKNTSGGLVQSMHRYAVTTKGDDVQGIETPDAFRAAIAPIDNERDAAVAVIIDGENYLSCDGLNAQKTATGYDVKVHTGSSCGAGSKEIERVYSVSTDGTVALKSEKLFREGDPGCVAGRRPEGLLAHASGECADAVGRFFAEAAHLEAASVFAFERLAGELLDLGAPEELIEAALSSREDEVRHTRMTSKMAKRFGGKPAAPRVEELPARSTLAIALENATEGCIRETWGALVAHRQATDATDETIRCMMQAIAEDETKHAGLAWDVAAWLEPQLSVDERVIVEDARRRALANLRRELQADPHPDLRTRAGMPDAATSLALLEALDQRFIAAA